MGKLYKDASSHAVILFDGTCTLCHWFIRFIIREDTNDVFRIGMLQSEKVHGLLKRIPMEDQLTTVLLFHDDKVESKSDAVLRIFRMLGGIWNVVYVFVIVPRPIRDSIYRLISGHRHRFFARRESCSAAAPGRLNKFMESLDQRNG